MPGPLFRFRNLLCLAAFALCVLAGGAVERGHVPDGIVAEAQAVIGRPGTPASFAGVARRTTRRVIRRSTVYVATLPRGCAPTTISGTALWLCGTTYYQQSGTQYVIVHVE